MHDTFIKSKDEMCVAMAIISQIVFNPANVCLNIRAT